MDLKHLRSVISVACRNAGTDTLPAELATIRRLSRGSNAAIETLITDLIYHLRAMNSQIRRNALEILQHMIVRSRRVRDIVFRDHLQELMKLTSPQRGIDPDLPPPVAAADDLRAQFNKYLNSWKKDFSCAPVRTTWAHYEKTRNKRLSETVSASLEREKEREQEELAQRNKSQELLADLPEKLETCRKEIIEIVEQVYTAMKLLASGGSEMRDMAVNLDIKAICSILDQLQGKEKEGEEEDEEEEAVEEIVQRYGLGHDDYSMSVSVGPSDEAKPEAVVNVLKDLAKVLNRQQLSKLMTWERTITRAAVSTPRMEQILTLKKNVSNVIDRITVATGEKAEQLDVISDEFGNELVSVPLDGVEDVDDYVELVKEEEEEKEEREEKEEEEREVDDLSMPMTKRQRLLAIAPTLPAHPALDYWGETEIVAGGMEVTHRFFGQAKESPKLDVKQLGLHLIPRKYVPPPVVLVTCRAPLPNGQLCSRKEVCRCPFHGKIVLRDEKGAMIVDKEKEREEKGEEREEKVERSKRPPRGYNDAVISRLSSKPGDSNGAGAVEEAAAFVDTVAKRRRGKAKKTKLLPLRASPIKRTSAKERLEAVIMAPSALEEEAQVNEEMRLLQQRKKFHNDWNAPM